MADGISEVDLFGDPVIPAQEGRGRPAHVPTLETRNRVLLCLARELTVKETATVIGISVPTLRQHYSSELKLRKIARLKMEMRQLELLVIKASEGSVSANKELDKRLEKLRLRDKSVAITKRADPKPPVLGKKEQARADAKNLKGRFATRTPPAGLMN